MFSNIGMPGWIMIMIIVLVIVGPKKLPEVGRAFGQTLREFKKSAQQLTVEEVEAAKEEIASTKEKA